MTGDDRLTALFDEACARPPAERTAFLDAACHGDEALRARLDQLLRADDEAARATAWQRSALDLEAEAASRTTDHELGILFGPYRLIRVLGAGGMGTVYEGARDDGTFRQRVAIKRLRPGLHAHLVVERFRSERSILAALDHPNIAKLFDGGTGPDGLPYFVMEYVEGRAPAAYADAHGLDARARVRMLLPVFDAVHHAHQRMVIHRDIKPGNILITEDGQPKLLDFGIAKLTSADQDAATLTLADGGALTLRYASPEQLAGAVVTTGTDVYSLAVVLFELLTGESPYQTLQGPTALMRAITDHPPRRAKAVAPSLPSDLDDILLKALSKSPTDRYASVAHFAADLRRFLEGLPVEARGHAWTYLARTFLRRYWWQVGAAATLMVSLAGGIVSTMRAEARAERRFQQVRQLARSVVFDYHDAIGALPGSTPLRQRLVSDALTYLDSLAQETDDPELQAELVDAYVRISNVLGNTYYANLGDTQGALTSARKAVAIGQQLLARDDRPAFKRSVGEALQAEAGLLQSGGDLATAESRLQLAVILHEQSTAEAPRDVPALLAYARALQHLGDIVGGVELQSFGRIEAGLTWYGRAATVVDTVLALAPGNEEAERVRAGLDTMIGTSQLSLGRRDEGIVSLRRAVSRFEAGITRRPDHPVDLQELSGAALRLALALIEGSQYAEALAPLDRAHRTMVSLAAADPKNTRTARNLAIVETHYSNALTGVGRLREAAAHNQASLAIARRLYVADPASVELAVDFAISARKTADALSRLGEGTKALPMANEAMQTLSALPPDDGAFIRSQIGRAHLTRGRVWQGLQQYAAAARDLSEGEKVARSIVDADGENPVWWSDLGRVQSALGAALFAGGQRAEAMAAWRRSGATWETLREKGALSDEDRVTAEEDARRLAAAGLSRRSQ
jgi:tetratricopeptide (TPR) repeat protein/tRNA A-37 threonylcarbamoyl transferase component Bud32